MLRQTIDTNLLGSLQAECRGEGVVAAFMATVTIGFAEP